MIEERSATRVDLAGGTLDCWPLFLMVGNCQTVNLAIDIYTDVKLEELSGTEVRLTVDSLDYDKSFSSLTQALDCSDKALTLIKPHLEYWQPSNGFHLQTFSQSPVGGGLGGSSSLCISLIKAFARWNNKKIELNKMITLASNIEAKILKTPTGTQDYFPPALGGLNILHYGVEGATVENLEVDFGVLNKHLLLVNTGHSHHSGINNWQVLKAAIEGDKKTLSSLAEIAEISANMAKTCRSQDWDNIPALFEREYRARTELCDSFSSPEICQLQDLSLRAGASAVKICGAGGGGCVLVWVTENKREEVTSACQKNGFQVLPIQAVKSR